MFEFCSGLVDLGVYVRRPNRGGCFFSNFLSFSHLKCPLGVHKKMVVVFFVGLRQVADSHLKWRKVADPPLDENSSEARKLVPQVAISS
jgi:hypothetical protein